MSNVHNAGLYRYIRALVKKKLYVVFQPGFQKGRAFWTPDEKGQGIIEIEKREAGCAKP